MSTSLVLSKLVLQKLIMSTGYLTNMDAILCAQNTK